jgi:hypothetical protein
MYECNWNKGCTYSNGFAQEWLTFVVIFGGFDIQINTGRRRNLDAEMVLFRVLWPNGAGCCHGSTSISRKLPCHCPFIK